MASTTVDYGEQLLFADHATDFGAAPATAANSLIIGTPTDVQFDLGSVAAAGARQSAKFDLGTARGHIWVLNACIENTSAPTPGGTWDFWIAPSPSGTAGTGNISGLTGSDAAWTYEANIASQAKFIGSLSVRNNVLNIGDVGYYVANHRYGILLAYNNTSTAAAATADEIHLTLTEIIPSSA